MAKVTEGYNLWKSLRSLLWAAALAIMPLWIAFLEDPSKGWKALGLAVAIAVSKVIADWLTHKALTPEEAPDA